MEHFYQRAARASPKRAKGSKKEQRSIGLPSGLAPCCSLLLPFCKNSLVHCSFLLPIAPVPWGEEERPSFKGIPAIMRAMVMRRNYAACAAKQ
jgi:hypothetical protein